MIENEYLRFLQTLATDEISTDVRKIANLILTHLDLIIPLSTGRGQRVRKIVELAQTNWNTVGEHVQSMPQQLSEQNHPFKQLKSLSVGPFRGFKKQEKFDLASELVLVYGPNGTGKSSFCEALEFGLLGYVAEAENKRYRQQDYIKNAHTDSFVLPVLKGIDKEGNELSISANEALYRFCFVEKNRIDSFSRIAAQAPSKQAELISTLFGLDAFNEFVRNFTDTISGQYIDLEGVKGKHLQSKREALSGYQNYLKFMLPEEIASIEADEKKLAEKFEIKCSFDEMVLKIQGTEESPGLIKKLDEELQQQPLQKSNVSVSDFTELVKSIKKDIKEIEEKQDELSSASQEVSFKQLYDAVTQLQNTDAEQCPACLTPLSQVSSNPFEHARSELDKLKHLSRLQEDVETLSKDIDSSLSTLSKFVDISCVRFPDNNPLLVVKVPEGKSATIDWWKCLLQKTNSNKTYLQKLEIQIKMLEESDKEIDLDSVKRNEKQARLSLLREINNEITSLKTRRATANSNRIKYEKAIADFEKENAQLILDSESEKLLVIQNKDIATAYSSFVQILNEYKDELPAHLVSNLGETVVDFYNAFNRYDDQSEMLASIRLPLSQNQKLEISFNNAPEIYFDALHVLSEGHVRCIGLAILLAKNLKEKCPLIIFDDPVNAIDDEHRSAIRETLFVDNYFKEKQLVIAVHGEEFFNQTLQLIGKRRAEKSHSYIFSSKYGQDLNVNSLNRPRNYILASREYFNSGEYRDALMSARRALEHLNVQIWKHYEKYKGESDRLISISKSAPEQPWSERALAENLKSKLNSSKANIPHKAQIVDSINVILGPNGNQPPWLYLNKGTHNDPNLSEFEHPIVKQIVEALEQIDNALNGSVMTESLS